MSMRQLYLKRFLCLLLRAVAALSLLCLPALAEESHYDLRVGGTWVTSSNSGDVLGDGTVSFSNADGAPTLTLKNANIRESFSPLDNVPSNGNDEDVMRKKSGIFYMDMGNLTIVLEGENTISGAGSMGSVDLGSCFGRDAGEPDPADLFL
jgi:hypothetical protein